MPQPAPGYLPPGSPGALPYAAAPGSAAPGAAPQTPGGKTRPTGLIVTAVVLGVLLFIAAMVAIIGLLQNAAANSTIREQRQQLDEQERELEKQRELIDQKEVFGAAMNRLVDEANLFAALPVGGIADWESYEWLASRAWDWRHDAAELEYLTLEAEEYYTELVATREAAEAQVASNSSGTVYESVLDSLGYGYVRVTFDSTGSSCSSDAWACVSGSDPYRVNVTVEHDQDWWITDWMRTGVAYHEMAHVLQLTNPEPTAEAVAHFDGNREYMADCFALTFLDGWTLDHTDRSGGYVYTTSVGYGYTCTDAQRDVMRTWYAQLVGEPRTVTS